MTRKSKSKGPKFGVFGAHFGKDLRRIWGCFGTWEAPFGRWEGNLDTSALKRGGGVLSPSPLLARKMAPGSSPGGVQGTRKSAEKTPNKETRGYVKRK